MPSKGEFSPSMPPAKEPERSTEIWRPTNVDIITISGHPGTGKTVTGQQLAERYGMEYIKVGDLFRQIIKDTRNEEVVGYTPRPDEMDLMLDTMQRELIRNARTEGRKIMLEGRLAGVIATEEQELARQEHTQISRVQRILFVADRDERIKRVLKRYPEYSPEEALKLTGEREQEDLTTWQKFHPAIQGLKDLYDPTLTNELGLPRFADFIVDTTDKNIQEVGESIHTWLVDQHLVETTHPSQPLPPQGDIFG